MSLIPRSRLIIDSQRSPSVAVTTIASPNSTPCHQDASKSWVRNTVPPATQATVEPAKPSQLLAGLTVGAIGCRPSTTPAAYPPTSLQTTVAMNVTTLRAPSSGTASSTANPARNGTYSATKVAVETSRR